MTGIASRELIIAGWTLITLYMGVVLYFVVRGAVRTKDISDYALGNIAFSPVAVGLALAASMTSAATFIINPGFIALYGISGVISYALVLPVAALVSLVVLTKGYRKQGNVVKALTMAQWIGKRYDSPGYALFFGVLSLLLITFIVLICVGLTKVLSKTLNLPELYMLIGIVVFIFGYMMFGGANSMVYTNTVQAILMLIVAFIILGSGYEHFSNGIEGFFAKLRAIDPNLTTSTNPASFLFRDYFEIVFCQIVVGIAIVCQPHIITKSLLLKTDRDVNRYLISGVIVEFIFFSVVIAGLYARLSFPDLTVNGAPLKMDGIMSAYVVKQFSVFVGLIVVMGLISAGISTLEGLIQAVSIGVMALATIFISYDQLIAPDLSVGIFAQNGVYVYFAAAFIPVLFGTFLSGVPKAVPILASITAIVVHLTVYYGRITSYMQAPVRNPAIAAALAILASAVVGGVAYLALKRRGAGAGEKTRGEE
jgi:sodium/pantothenate symporter